ncbi:unnamed protein product, partial [Musa acuminata subsp. burmannicoides]
PVLPSLHTPPTAAPHAPLSTAREGATEASAVGYLAVGCGTRDNGTLSLGAEVRSSTGKNTRGGEEHDEEGRTTSEGAGAEVTPVGRRR